MSQDFNGDPAGYDDDTVSNAVEWPEKTMKPPKGQDALPPTETIYLPSGA